LTPLPSEVINPAQNFNQNSSGYIPTHQLKGHMCLVCYDYYVPCPYRTCTP
jgi:hypothetical protein